MKVVVNSSPGNLFRLSARAYGRLMALGTKVKSHNQDDGSDGPREVVIYDCAHPDDQYRPEVSDLPPDEPTDHGWLHTDARYYDNVYSDEQWARADPNLVRVVEELGEHAGQMGCVPMVVTIPDDVDEWSLFYEEGRECIGIRRGSTWTVCH